MKRKLTLWMISSLMMFFLSGCWSQKELTDIAIISALGVDTDSDGKFVGTFQFVNPGNVASGLQGGGGGQTTSVNVYTAEGDNIVELSRSGTTKVSRRLYYSHTNLVVIGEKLARETGIESILEALNRDNEFRSTTTIVIARDTKAENIVKILTPIEKIPSNQVLKTLEFTEQFWGENISLDLEEVKENMIASGREPTISGFIVKGDPENGDKQENIQSADPEVRLEASGIGIFKGGKLLDWLDGIEARGTMFILNKIKATSVSIDWQEEEEVIAFELNKNKTKIKVVADGASPKIILDVKSEGDIGEAAVPVNIENQRTLQKIEKAVEDEIKYEIQRAIEKVKEKKSDIFGFGQAIYRSNPKEWKRLEEDWNDTHFPELSVEINVDVQVKRTGTRTNPFLFPSKKE